MYQIAQVVGMGGTLTQPKIIVPLRQLTKYQADHVQQYL